MNKQIENIRVHLAELLSDEISEHACIDRKEHSIDFQVFRLLTGYEEALQKIKILEAKLATVDNYSTDNPITFHCFHCNSDVLYSNRTVEKLYEYYKEWGLSWWPCPVCGCKTYFKEAYDIALRKHNAPRVALP
jgi:hypothetical protein